MEKAQMKILILQAIQSEKLPKSTCPVKSLIRLLNRGFERKSVKNQMCKGEFLPKTGLTGNG